MDTLNQVLEKFREIKDTVLRVSGEIGPDNLDHAAEVMEQVADGCRQAANFLRHFESAKASAAKPAAVEGEAPSENAGGQPVEGDVMTREQWSHGRAELHGLREEFARIKRGAPAGAPPGRPVAAIGPLWQQLIADLAIKVIDAVLHKFLPDGVPAGGLRLTPTDR